MVTKGYGLKPHDIDWSCPADLEPYSKEYQLEERKIDERLYSAGLYNKIAQEVVMAHFGAGLAGKKSKAEYPKEPFLLRNTAEKQNKNTYNESQEEIAVFEMKQRIKALRAQGLPESPL